MELDEFDDLCRKMCFENVIDPKLKTILIRHLIKVCLAAHMELEEIQYHINDCYCHYEEILNASGIL